MTVATALSPPSVEKIVLGEQEIQSAVRRLGGEVAEDYRDDDPVLVGVLNGAFFFACDLVRQIDTRVTLDFVSLRSFCPEESGSTQVEIMRDLEVDICGRHVLILEDLVDTGLSLHYLCNVLEQRRPSSLHVCTLLERPQLRLVDVPLRYRGFEVDDQFLVGYGLDFQNHFRCLPYIAALKGTPKQAALAPAGMMAGR